MSRSQKSEFRSQNGRRVASGARHARASGSQLLAPGFSLTEVMFAVIVMGIGFIMVAAMFPVTISQSRLTVEETSAAATARSAMADTTRLAEGGDSFRGTTIPPTWGPLLPPTDLYRSPPTDQQNQSAAMGPAPFTVSAHSTVTVPGKVLSFFD